MRGRRNNPSRFNPFRFTDTGIFRYKMPRTVHEMCEEIGDRMKYKEAVRNY